MSEQRCVDAERSVLVLVDYPQRLMPALDGGEAALCEALRLAEAALGLGIAVLGTEQNPPGLGPNDERIRERCASTLAQRKRSYSTFTLDQSLGGRARAAARDRPFAET